MHGIDIHNHLAIPARSLAIPNKANLFTQTIQSCIWKSMNNVRQGQTVRLVGGATVRYTQIVGTN